MSSCQGCDYSSNPELYDGFCLADLPEELSKVREAREEEERRREIAATGPKEFEEWLRGRRAM